MENKLIIGPFAEEDIKQAKGYYEMQKDGLGDEFMEDMEQTIKKIVQNLLQYPKTKKDMRKAGLNRFPYGIFYIFKSSVVNV